MVYVGRGLPPVQETWGRDIEPALIDPSLAVDRAHPDRNGSSLDYWPSYHGLSARARAGYLDWLAGGRRAPGVNVGFVFLFFYGIERRLLFDAQDSQTARDEASLLIDEVERLLEAYGENQSFGGYARSFVEVGRLLHRSVPLSELVPTSSNGAWEVPLTTRLALGVFANRGEPVPMEWALSWALTSPLLRRRTPVQRCPDEFRQLFGLRYADHFRASGLKIKPNKTRLAAEYRPASASLGHIPVRLAVPDLPDVAGLAGPIRKLQELVDRVTDELDPFSRWIGRNDERFSVQALSLLPVELGRLRESAEGGAFAESIAGLLAGSEWALVEVEELAKAWTADGSPGSLAKKESEMLARLLDQHGFGLEPDVRWGGPSLRRVARAVVYRQGPVGTTAAAGPSNDYRLAAALLALASAVSAADGEIGTEEREHLERHLEHGLELLDDERLRLRNHLRWLMAQPPSLATVKRLLSVSSAEEGRSLGRFLLAVAGADGRIDPEEIEILRKIYPLLGLAPDDVISDLHALQAGGGVKDNGPVTVLPGKVREGFAIPVLAPGEALPAKTVLLDPAKIDLRRKETERVAERLAGVFASAEEEAAPPPPPPEPSDARQVCGLDAMHSAFLLRLAERESWQRSDIERLAQEVGVFPEGALELVNDAAFDACGEPLFEGDETLVIDRGVLGVMTT
jgi:tellurite resistance protein